MKPASRTASLSSSVLHRVNSSAGVRVLRALCTAALLAITVQPAHAADALDTLINIASIVLGEPALNDARPLIECVKDKGPAACVNVSELATAQGKKAAKQFLPDDPRIATTVEIVKAAYAKDLLKVLELTGVEFLPQVACDLGFAAAGPVKAFICGPVFKKAAGLAKPVVAQVLETVQHPNAGNLFELVTVIDIDLACDLIPSFPGKDEICGPLGKVATMTKDAAIAAAKAGKAAGEFLLDQGKQLVAGIGNLAEGACQVVGLCDDGGSKLMSPNQYYKYVLFPRIHDRVLARLLHGQQNLGHDMASQQACLKYYHYDTIVTSIAAAAAPKIKKACDDVGARLHNEASAMAQAFAAAPAPFFETAVKPLVPTMAVEGYGQNKLPGFRKFVTGVCVANLRKNLALVEPTQPGKTAWDVACENVGGLYETAYNTQEKHLAGELARLALFGACKVPAGWAVASKGVKLECDSYTGYQYCLKTLAPGKEKDRCAVNAALADTKLATKIVATLGTRRCHAENGAVACTRPWKADSCKALVATAMLPAGMKPGVKCAADLAGFAVLETKANGTIASLNGARPAGSTVGADARKQGLVMVTPGGGAHCSHTWDPLAIRCDDAKAWHAQIGTNASLQLPHCPTDPAFDGADAPCYAMPLQVANADQAPALAGPATGALPAGAATPKLESRTHSALTTAAVQSPSALPRPPAAAILPPRVALTPSAAAPSIARVASPLAPPVAATSARAESSAGNAYAPAGCTRGPGTDLRFTCRDAGALARCETLRKQNRVQACLLGGRG